MIQGRPFGEEKSRAVLRQPLRSEEDLRSAEEYGRNDMRRIGILLLLLGLLSSAFTRSTGARPASVTSRPTEISTSALPSAASLPGPGSTHIPLVPTTTITRADLGQTLRLAVGETFALRLGGDTAWDVQVTDPRGIAPDRARISGPGEQGIYRARAAGRP